MDNHSFDVLMGSLASLTDQQLDMLKSEILSCRQTTHEQILTDEELGMIRDMFAPSDSMQDKVKQH
ncbi:hypothetical protein [Photobacterium atrarenae]|uniref:Uncharacterized protein n=1 Tax=Photobacterium atrarenae TaxID=865757 RepID=A0ABY5GIV0_9GAMM|nr:hypothetical protein [Photobacterium atrarenae]UTV29132.1 hypothetical protein NNL38_07890 [Photobacterium atrarenae]